MRTTRNQQNNLVVLQFIPLFLLVLLPQLARQVSKIAGLVGQLGRLVAQLGELLAALVQALCANA